MKDSRHFTILSGTGYYYQADGINAIAISNETEYRFQVERVVPNGLNSVEDIGLENFVCESGRQVAQEWVDMLNGSYLLLGSAPPTNEWLTSENLSNTLPLTKSLVDWLRTNKQLFLVDKLIENRIVDLNMLKFVSDEMLRDSLNVDDAMTRKSILKLLDDVVPIHQWRY